MINNIAIALDHKRIEPAEWLRQVDAGVQATFDKLVARDQVREAYLMLGAHLAKTEFTRRRLHGTGPDPASATAAYFDCFYRQYQDIAARLITRINLMPSSGASTAPVQPLTCPAGPGTKDSNLTALLGPGAAVERSHRAAAGESAPASCAPDEHHLRDLLDDIEGPEPCDHVRGHWTCIRGSHPFNPGGHVYVAGNGSDVPDRHSDGPEDY